jgi:DNA-binding transcriptional MocR family regulator
MRALLEGLVEHLPAKRAAFTRPQGGYTLLLTVRSKRPLSEDQAMERFREAGVLLSPGSLYFCTPPKNLCFRVSVANLSVEKIKEGCRRLGTAMAAMV